MRRIILISLMFLFGVNLYAQIKVQPEVGFSQTFASLGYFNKSHYQDNPNYQTIKTNQRSYNYYSTYELKAGVRLQKRNFSIGIYSQNQLLTRQVMTLYSIKKKSYLMSYLLGAGIDIRYFENKRIRPFVRLNFLSEISTNYKDKTLYPDFYYPITLYIAPSYENGFIINSILYLSTPFEGNFLIGCDFLIVSGFSVNIALGYGLRAMKIVNSRLTFNPTESNTIPVKKEYIGNSYILKYNMLDIQLGFNYTFSFKKKPKTDTP